MPLAVDPARCHRIDRWETTGLLLGGFGTRAPCMRPQLLLNCHASQRVGFNSCVNGAAAGGQRKKLRRPEVAASLALAPQVPLHDAQCINSETQQRRSAILMPAALPRPTI